MLNICMTWDDYAKFRSAFKDLVKNKQLLPCDVLLHNIVRGLNPTRGFTIITNDNKKWNGLAEDRGYRKAIRDLHHQIRTPAGLNGLNARYNLFMGTGSKSVDEYWSVANYLIQEVEKVWSDFHPKFHYDRDWIAKGFRKGADMPIMVPEVTKKVKHHNTYSLTALAIFKIIQSATKEEIPLSATMRIHIPSGHYVDIPANAINSTLVSIEFVSEVETRT